MNELSRRAMLGAGATAAALVGGAALNAAVITAAKAAESDPIFAAIESYRRAYAFHEDCLVKADADGVAECETDRLQCLGSEAELDAIDALLQTAPTTSGGALALVQLLKNEGDLPMETRTTLGNSFYNDDAIAFLSSIETFLRGRQS